MEILLYKPTKATQPPTHPSPQPPAWYSCSSFLFVFNWETQSIRFLQMEILIFEPMRDIHPHIPSHHHNHLPDAVVLASCSFQLRDVLYCFTNGDLAIRTHERLSSPPPSPPAQIPFTTFIDPTLIAISLASPPPPPRANAQIQGHKRTLAPQSAHTTAMGPLRCALVVCLLLLKVRCCTKGRDAKLFVSVHVFV